VEGREEEEREGNERGEKGMEERRGVSWICL